MLDPLVREFQKDADELRRIGDTLQSSASRLSEAILTNGKVDAPYEVQMAALEARDAVAEWTAARSSHESSHDA